MLTSIYRNIWSPRPPPISLSHIDSIGSLLQKRGAALCLPVFTNLLATSEKQLCLMDLPSPTALTRLHFSSNPAQPWAFHTVLTLSPCQLPKEHSLLPTPASPGAGPPSTTKPTEHLSMNHTSTQPQLVRVPTSLQTLSTFITSNPQEALASATGAYFLFNVS